MDEMQWKDSNAAFWGGVAARWRARGLPTPDNTAGFWDDDITRLVADLGCSPEVLLLDVGCGPGLWSVALARAGYRVRGSDISPQMIGEARELAAEHGVQADPVSFAVGAADQIDATAAGVDGILCRNVLDFVPVPGVALAEFWRVLKPGCRLVVSVVGAASPIKSKAWRRFLPGGTASVPTNGILPWEAETLLGEMGWIIVGHRPTFGPAASGAPNAYTRAMAERLGERILQQTIATTWQFVAVKPA
jgi:SAM-dependent methyltransferase